MTSIAIPQPARAEESTYHRRRVAWAFYDWANSSVVTIIVATVFPLFYNTIAGAELGVNAASAFSFTVAIGLLISAFAGPIVGTLGDIVGGRKRLLIVTTLIGALAVIGMYTLRAPYCAVSGFGELPFCPLTYYQSGMWVLGALLYVVVQIFLNTSLGLYDSLLSHVAVEADRDRTSALGYGLGYIGGGLILAFGFALILVPRVFGLAGTEAGTRLTLLLAGVWWFIFALPLFLTVPEPPASPLEKGATGNAIRDTFKRLGTTFREIRGYSELFKMLIAFWLYSDGIGTIIQLATTYGQQQIGLSQTVLIGALLLTQFVAFPYAIMFGRIPDKTHKQRDFFVAFIIWTVVTFPVMAIPMAAANNSTGTPTEITLGIVAVNQVIGLIFSWFIGRRLFAPITRLMDTKRGIILGLLIYAIISVWGFFLYTAAEFWMLAWLVGTVQGGTQALSRSLYSTLCPRSKSGEFFGFYGFSDKFAGILGPVIFGVIGVATGGNLRLSILSVIVFFILGAWLLSRVDEVKGAQHAEEEDAQAHYPDEFAAQPGTL